MTNKRSPFIDFALEHGTGETYLAPIVALWRCEALLDDLEALDHAARTVGRKQEPVFSFEIVPYYLVGFVTCLEWHTRARVVDSLAYRPEAIEARHFERLTKDLLAQMIRSNVTVPYLLGATTRVSNFDDYDGAFRAQVFSSLGAEDAPRRIAARVPAAKREAAGLIWPYDLNEIIDDLYVRRHRLVHELADVTCGPPEVRDAPSLDEARQYGRAALLLMRQVEDRIRELAPADFPNLLDDAYQPESQLAVLEDKIDALVTDLERRLSKTEDDYVIKTWRESAQADVSSRSLRHIFMEQVSFSSYDYISPRQELYLIDLKQRIAYLEKLLDFLPTDMKDGCGD